MKLIVSNTGPLLHLKEAQALDLLALTGEVHIPKNVEREISNLDPAWSQPAWLMVNDLIEPYTAKAISWQQAGWLHAGEAEALSLAQQLQPIGS
jgi:predicted nucleic acid-binding protein